MPRAKKSNHVHIPNIKTLPTPSRKSGKYHIIDAKQPLMFIVTAADMRGSRVGDPNHCAGACALKRQTGGEAWVKRSITYIAYPNKPKVKGKIVAVRYMNPLRLTKAVNGYDKTAGLFPEGTYRLRAPYPTVRLEDIDAYNRARKKKGYVRPKKAMGLRHRPVFYLR